MTEMPAWLQLLAGIGLALFTGGRLLGRAVETRSKPLAFLGAGVVLVAGFALGFSVRGMK